MIESHLASRPGRPGWSRAVPAAAAIAAVGLLAAAAAAENSDVAGSLKVLAHLRWTWLAAGIALEVISIAAFAAMFRQLLKAGRVTPRRSEMLVTVYAANAMSVSVPLAGPGLAAAYLFRRFTRFGAGAAGAGWTLLAGGVISATAWVVVLAAGGLASGHAVALAITVPALALAVTVAATIAVAARYPRVRQVLENFLTRALTQGARLLRWPATDPKLALRAWAQRFGALRLPASDWALALGGSLLNWFTDAAVLTVGIVAVGARVPWHDLLLVYAAGVGAQGLSLTPGGLAITEGAISLALVASGMHVRGRRRRRAVPADQLLVQRRAGVADPAGPPRPQARGAGCPRTRAGAVSRASAANSASSA